MVSILFILLATEGFKVKSIDFHNNRAFSDKKLKGIIYTAENELYDEFQVNMDKRRIINFYRSRGFKYARVTDWSKTIVDFPRRIIKCDIYIEEGIRQYVREIGFEGNKFFNPDKLLKLVKLRIGSPVDKSQFFLSACKIADYYAEYGYAYTEVKDTLIELDNDTLCSNVKLIFQITEHNRVRFGNIQIKGNRQVRTGIINREIAFKKWNIYSPQKLYLSQTMIYGTDLFESVRFELQGTESKRDTVDVVFLLKEKAPRWVSFGGGYSSPNRAWFNTGWGHSNLWNNGQNLSINCKYEINPFRLEELQKIEISLPYREPYFLNSSFKAEVLPFYKIEKDTGYQLTYMGAQGRIGKYIGRYTQSFLTYNYEIVTKRGNVPETGGIINSLIFSISCDTRNDIFYPRMGAIESFSYEYAGLNGDYNFRKFEAAGTLISRYLHTIIVMRLKVGGILGEASLERKFVLGGVNTIRGYPDMMYLNVTEEHKDWITLLNLEFRIPIKWKVEIAYFMDAGNVWQEIKNIKIEEVKLGTGLGIRFRTPIGPIRVDYGRPIIETENSKGRGYFGIGYMF
ncbi:MAG: BamA/TamA family outer membrane protein [Candidatus Stahlbacteria bacterium]|nr:BamA/TamA family outer membrane protein [Candidatus Stahlbacteria bacterium]